MIGRSPALPDTSDVSQRTDDDLMQLMRVIETETDDFPLVKSSWDKTFLHRQQLLKNKHLSTDLYLAMYPVFSLNSSYQLVLLTNSYINIYTFSI